jgi:hypothetical protein
MTLSEIDILKIQIMDQEIGYDEAGETTDIEVLVEYCKQGAIDNNERNNCTLDEWRDGCHLIESYLDHNNVVDAETLKAVANELTDWLRGEIETATPISADRYGDRTVLVRKEPRPSERWYWCDAKEGGVFGTNVTRYVRFLNRDEAIETAKRLGYEVLED